MIYRDRNGKEISGNEGQNRLLERLCGCAAGRFLLRLLARPRISRMAGAIMDTRVSSLAVSLFVKKYHICLEECEKQSFSSWNDFFCRKLRQGSRPVSTETDVVVSPCDGKLTVYEINEKLRISLKGRTYSLESLLKNTRLAARYAGGLLFVFRLTVDDCHRYCYIAGGKKSANVHIPGVFHSVNPHVTSYFPVYHENTREYSLLHTRALGTVLMAEVGAMMVGRIVNHHGVARVKKGEEKGYFAFGGSTVILGFEKDRVTPDADILKNSAGAVETIVRQGERVGVRLSAAPPMSASGTASPCTLSPAPGRV